MHALRRTDKDEMSRQASSSGKNTCDANPMPFKFNKSRAGVAVGAGCALGSYKPGEREKEGERGRRGGGKDGMYRCVVYLNDKYTWDGMIGVVELVEM